MNARIDWSLLARYLADECTPAEAATVESWLEADPARRRLLGELESIWSASSEPSLPMDAIDLDADWHRLSDAMPAADAPHAPSQPGTDRPARTPRRRHTGVPSLQRVLHVLLIGLVCIGSLWLGIALWDATDPAPGFREVVAERGERANIQLVDGTEVTLNVDSRLRIPSTFDDTRRTVHLEGEAYFDVATDSTRPFVISTDGAVIDVHGTAFNVRSYPDDRRVQVAVVEGAVSLRAPQSASPHESARLTPGQMGHLATDDPRVLTQTVDSMVSVLGWMDGRLVFDNEALTDVATRLARWYDVQFEIADPALDSLRLTADLKSRSIDNVMEVITASLGIQYRIDRNTVVLLDDVSPVHPPSP